MPDDVTDTARVVVVRELTHPPNKVWRALTQQALVAEWLGHTSFEAVVGHRFTVQIEPQPDRIFVFDCEVLVVEPHRRLTYAWNTAADASGTALRSTVTWRLTATPDGTRLRMEQSGFERHQRLYFHGARAGWPQFIDRLDALLTRAA